MADFKYEPRGFPPRFRGTDQQNNFENDKIQHPMTGHYSSFENPNIGACGDRLFELECQLATSLSKELLSALDAPTKRPLPNYERNKVACLKNAILELEKENDALHEELRKTEYSRIDNEDKHKEWEHSRLHSVGAPGVPVNGTTPLHLKRDVACQTAGRSLKRHDRTSKSRRSGSGSSAFEPSKNYRYPQASATSHSKCVDWLTRKKPLDAKREDLDLARLALWRLWELVDYALTHNGESNESFGVSCSENTTRDEGETEKNPEQTNCPSKEIDQLRLRLEHLLRSKNRIKRKRDEQAILLRQKEMQVSRLQRSRHNLMHTFRSQLLMLRQQQALELKALRLEMQTERASSLAGQTAQLEDQLKGAVEQLEERYRNLLKDAYSDRSKDPSWDSLLSSVIRQRSRDENGP